MHCFTHRDNQALAICKTCGKAVCSDCAISSPLSISCSSECEEVAKTNHEMNLRAKKLYGIGSDKKKIPTGVIIWGIFAIFFGGAGIVDTVLGKSPDWFLLCFGAASVLIAIIAYRRAKETGLQC